jgi:hypothetical protein
MFVRFRKAKHRLQVSLVNSRRVDGKICQEHVAALGSIDISPSVEARLTFWQTLHQRLRKLSDYVDAAMQRKIMADVHARIPLGTIDEQRALKLLNAGANEQFWQSMREVSDKTQLPGIIEQPSVDEGMEGATVQGTTGKRRGRRSNSEDARKPLVQKEFIAVLALIASNARYRLLLERIGWTWLVR